MSTVRRALWTGVAEEKSLNAVYNNYMARSQINASMTYICIMKCEYRLLSVGSVTPITITRSAPL